MTTTTGMCDEHLVRAALNGDSDAFGRPADRYRNAAFGIAYHRTGNAEAARDVSQEALLTAYTDLPMLRDHRRFANWLFRITVLKAAAYVRSQKDTVPLEAPELINADTDDPCESVFRSDQNRLVREALSALPESDRLVIDLRYFGGYSHEEIGEITGMTVPAIKSRIHRARACLREEMLSMEKGSTGSRLPTMELTEDLIRVVTDRHPEERVAIIRNIVSARVEFTEQTADALLRVAAELAEEGYIRLVAPPHIPADSPAIKILQGIGFRAEQEMRWYERGLESDLPEVEEVDSRFSVRPVSDLDASRIAGLFGQDAPGISENHVRHMIGEPSLAKEASLAATVGDRIAALVTTYRFDEETPKYPADSAVIWWARYDQEVATDDVLRHIMAKGLRSLASIGVRCVIKDQVTPGFDDGLVPVLTKLGFVYIRSQLNMVLDLQK